MPKPTKNYCLRVDSYRRPSRMRNTAGRYRVGAKSPKEAIQLLRDTIGFGSILVYYEHDPYEENEHMYNLAVPYKAVVKETFTHENGELIVYYEKPHHANDPQKSYAEKTIIRRIIIR